MKIEIKTKNLIIGLIILVVLLGTIFIVIPEYNNSRNKDIILGANMFVFNYILPQLNQTGYVRIPIGKKVLYLVPFNPNKTIEGGKK